MVQVAQVLADYGEAAGEAILMAVDLELASRRRATAASGFRFSRVARMYNYSTYTNLYELDAELARKTYLE